METNNKNFFDPTPRLKFSPIPILFIPFNINDSKCNVCGNDYSKTLLYEQKYCKKCLAMYIKDTANNEDNDTYLDIHINNDKQGTSCNVQEWREYSEISYFKQIFTSFFSESLYG